MIGTDDYLRTIDLPPVRGNSKLGHRATDEELVKIYATCQSDSNRDIRDLSILRLMFGLGLRVGEVVPLQLADYNRNSGELQIFGKGRKHRDVFLCGSIRATMESWLERRGLHTGALYEVIGWDDEIYHRPMASTISIWEIFDKRCRRASIRRLSPHDARRTAISNMLNLADALTCAKLVGHSNPGITLHYDLRGDTEKLAACEKVGAR
jgi:integrase